MSINYHTGSIDTITQNVARLRDKPADLDARVQAELLAHSTQLNAAMANLTEIKPRTAANEAVYASGHIASVSGGSKKAMEILADLFSASRSNGRTPS